MAEEQLTTAIKSSGDIDQHLIYLLKLSSSCESILEYQNGLTILERI